MSKVFKSIAPGSNATIEVAATDGNVTVYVRQNIGAIDLSANDAPALALAILEAAGVEPLSEYYGNNNDPADAARHAVYFLIKHAALTEAEAKEAADREALELEALDLLNGFRAAAGHPPHKRLSDTGDVVERWRAVARTARTLHGGAK